jgi:hypothetical protein
MGWVNFSRPSPCGIIAAIRTLAESDCTEHLNPIKNTFTAHTATYISRLWVGGGMSNLIWCVVSWTSPRLSSKKRNVLHLFDTEAGYTLCGIREIYTWTDVISTQSKVCKKCEAEARKQGREIVKWEGT